MRRGATPISWGGWGAWALALLSIGCRWAALPVVSVSDPADGSRRFREIRRYPAPAARQAVAVDGAHFYAIGNHSIEKVEKRGGVTVASWMGPASGPIVHLRATAPTRTIRGFRC